MILAAGRGQRMKPLTDTCPKPLLKVKGQALIVYHLIKLANIGIKDVVINHAWLGEQIEQTLGDGKQWGVTIRYSAEQEALETAGGIIKALPLLLETNIETDIEINAKGKVEDKILADEPFLVVNGDVYTHFDFTDLPTLSKDQLAHLWLVPNPEHNIKGDFALVDGQLQNLPMKSLTTNTQEVGQDNSYTYSGIALFRSEFFQQYVVETSANTLTNITQRLPLGPMLRKAVDLGKVSASIISQQWTDVGTPERLAQLNNY